MRRFYISPLLMRLLWLSIIACTAACGVKTAVNLPPTDSLYFPTGIVFVDDPNLGYVYVASSNFDRRFDMGSVSAIQLSAVSDARGQTLPPLGQPIADGMPHTFENLGAPLHQIYIQTFAGEMDQYRLPTGQRRLFVPSRGDRNPLQIIDVQGNDMVCIQPGENCGESSLSLTAFQNSSSGKPAAPEPIGVGISNEATGAQVFVTHLKDADSPFGSGRSFESYVVYLSADTPDVPNFVSLGLIDDGYGQTTNSVVVGQRYAYVTNRYHGTAGAMILLVDRLAVTAGTPPIRYPYLEATFSTLEARGIALGRFTPVSGGAPDETRLYVGTRSPEALVVVALRNPTDDIPTLQVVRTVPLPDGTNGVKVVPRARLNPPLGDLVVITSSTAGAVTIYDDDLGRVVAQIFGVGVQPYGIAVQARDTSARIFITDFGDGRIAVIDIAQLWRPQDARLIAYLGKGQTCPSTSTEVICLGNPP